MSTSLSVVLGRPFDERLAGFEARLQESAPAGERARGLALAIAELAERQGPASTSILNR